MRGVPDALRSVKRHVALTLGEEWEVRLTEEEGAFERPFARVGITGSAQPGGPAAWQVRWRATFNVVAHPVETSTPAEALMEAERVRMLLFDALRGGGAEPGRPKRIPLWDYAGVPVDRDVSDDAALVAANPWLVLVARDPRDFLRADATDDPTTDVLGDPNDELMYVVTAAMPLWWGASTARPTVAPVVAALPVNPAAS